MNCINGKVEEFVKQYNVIYNYAVYFTQTFVLKRQASQRRY